ncbi:USP domain-containing protein [Mycena chlorophos]|uniref:ubiquitinyl hydrolase 1 n=1 Tax=Mycena chlorophos TaxID=658473 RepID=A0A8H6S8E7_MYCCL|nr:USP domain-containing protein [Mycena chlorophos]
MRTTTTDFLVQQLAPLLVVLAVPIFALGAFSFLRPRLARFQLLVMALGALLPWNWANHDKQSSSSTSQSRESTPGKPVRIRTRAEQVATTTKPVREKSPPKQDSAQDALFPGLVNMSGTHCFMNSTLQALASLSFLTPYLLSIRTRAEALDVPTPVVDALIDLLDQLNTPDPAGRPLKATALVEALCSPPPSMDNPSDDEPAPSAASALSAFWGSGSTSLNLGASAKATALLASHEHQDAQELFQLISECVRDDATRVAKEGARDRGFALVPEEGEAAPLSSSSPFDGLTATRRSCVRCGYTAAIRHFAFDTIQLALESAGGGWTGVSIYQLLKAYINLEVLQDCSCRRCELRATARRLREEIQRLESNDPNEMPTMNGHAKPSDPTPSRIRRLKVVRKMEVRVTKALETGRIEEEDLEGDWENDAFVHGVGVDALKGVRIERVPGGVSTRQTMIGRPPTVLALHINRSVHTAMRVAKNGAPVAFPELLDLTPYTTDGILNLDPTAALSGSVPTRTPTTCLYRLAAAVCHYGQHSFGHYICFRRTPVAADQDKYVPAAPTPNSTAGTGTGWLRISDSRVDRCGIEQVLAEGSAVFMLYYERVLPSQAVYADTAAAAEAADSTETIRPAQVVGAFGVGVDIASSSSSSSSSSVRSLNMGHARVVRSVMLGSRASSVSSLSLPSTTDEPGTPKAAPSANGDVEVDVVEPLTLNGDASAVVVVEEEAIPLPTPPPTPKDGSEAPLPPESQPPTPSKSKKKKKKKANGAATAASTAPVPVAVS